MTIETILGLAVPIIGGIAEIAKSNKPSVVEKVEVKETMPVVQPQQQAMIKPINQIDHTQPPINVNFNLNIFINGKKMGEKESDPIGNRIIIDA